MKRVTIRRLHVPAKLSTWTIEVPDAGDAAAEAIYRSVRARGVIGIDVEVILDADLSGEIRAGAGYRIAEISAVAS